METLNKSKELKTSIELINDKLNFSGIVEGNAPISIDYVPPLGDNLGYTSLELMLLSLSSCVGSTVLSFLRRMDKTITSFKIHSNGARREEHPTGFKSINLQIEIESSDVSNEDLEKVIGLSRETYCPVWSMFNDNVEIKVEYSIS